MIEDKEATVEQDEPTPELDSIIDAAIGSDDAPADEQIASEGRPRDENGRFKAKEEITDSAEGGEQPVAEAGQEGVAPPEPAAAPQWTDGHFVGWTPEQRQHFQTLSPEHQQFMMDRVQGTQAHFQRQNAELNEYKAKTERLAKVASDVAEYAQGIGTTPDELLASYAQADYQLRYLPYEEKIKFFAGLAKHYGIPYAMPEIDDYADPAQPGGQAYPIVHDLQRTVNQLQSKLSVYEQRQSQNEAQAAQSYLQTFASTKNDDGSPKYPLFEMVRPAMYQLMKTNQEMSVEDAYKHAVAPIEGYFAKAQTSQQKAQRQAIEKAKKAAPVRSSGIAPGGSTKSGNLDDIINGALASSGM